jgi:anti-sigma factor RsiW
MNHEETRTLLDAYFDGELDLVRSLDVERHVAECNICSAILGRRQAIRDSLKTEGLYFTAPSDLQARILNALPAAIPTREPISLRRPSPAQWGILAAALLIFALGAAMVLRGMTISPAQASLSDEVLASHLRSLIGNHLADVVSTDQHTVKPWFDGKLDYSPPVVDLAASGFPLIGGRLDYLDKRDVAALVYQRNKHVINVFVWPAKLGDTGTATRFEQQGYGLISWSQAGMNFWAVSDVNSADLNQFVQLLQAAIPSVGGTPEAS